MRHSAQFSSGQTHERPTYFVSDRPEAYEVWGEVSREEAEQLARLIAEHAAKRFPGIEFRIDSNWHTHDASTGGAAEYIESHWQAWAASLVDEREPA